MSAMLETLSGIFLGQKVTDNVGAPLPKSRDIGRKKGRGGLGESTVRTVEAPAKTVLGRGSEGNREGKTEPVAPVPEFLTTRYRGEIVRATEQARCLAERNNRPLGVVLSEQAKNIFGQLEKRTPNATTEQKYLRAYNLMLKEGRTPIEKATTRQAFDFYRSAWRFGIMAEIQRLGRSSEKARKAGHLESAQRRTSRQFQFAIALEASMLDTWAPKAKAVKRAGGTVKSKSKNPSKGGPVVPSREFAMAPLIVNGGRQQRVVERHTERLAVLEAFGVRPSELLKGVRLEAITTKRGNPRLRMIVEGAKWDGDTKGQQARSVFLTPTTASEKGLFETAQANGGKFILKSTPADVRSLNRVLAKATEGLSCYSYRHAFGGSLKVACLDGSMTREEAAKAMGHRSTESLSYYGQPSKSGGRKLRAEATDTVRNPSKPMNKAAMGKKTEPAFKFPGRPTPQTPTAKATMRRPVSQLAGGPKPPKR